MKRPLSISTAANVVRVVTLEGIPDRCPRCHSNMVPKSLAHAARSESTRDGVEEALQCTNTQCGAVFIAFYGYNSRTGEYDFRTSFPKAPVPPAVGALVRDVSPNFYETYTQALASEGYGLAQLTGIGLRKALEFLVKDFAVAEHPTDREKILKKALAACIKDYISDENTREMARRAAWLGNDETHYVRRWEDKDVNDLKVLIRLTVNGIENVLLARKYQVDMPEP